MQIGQPRHTFEFVNGLRGLAALQVVLLHYCSSFLPLFARAGQPAHYGFETRFGYSPGFFLIDGYSAVYLFFLMSGFVLAPSFLASRSGIRLQIAKRFTRLYIPVAGALALALALRVFVPSAKEFVAGQSGSQWVQWLFENPLTILAVLKEFAFNSMLLGYQGTSILDRLFTMTPVTHSLDAPLWTIHIEFWGSLLVMFICAVYRQIPKQVFWFLFALLLVCLGASYFSLFLVGFALFSSMDRLLMCNGRFCQTAGFAMIAIAIVVSSSVHPEQFASILAAVDKIAIVKVPEPQAVQRELCAILLFVGVILLGAHRCWLEVPWLRWLGRISFSLYLVHFPLLFTATFLVFETLTTHFSYGASVLGATVVMLLVTLVVAHFFEKYVDQRAISLSRHLEKLGRPALNL